MLMLSFIVTNSKGLSFKWKKKCFSVNWIVGAKSPVIMLQSSKCINVMKRCLESTMTSVRSTWNVSLISLHHLPRWACCLGKSDSASSADSFFFLWIFFTLVYCLLSGSLHLLAWTAVSVMAPLFLTGIRRLIVCCSLSEAPSLVRPACDLMHSIYWGCLNNLSLEFSPTLTFPCLMPAGFGFNNTDSAPFLLCPIR